MLTYRLGPLRTKKTDAERAEDKQEDAEKA